MPHTIAPSGITREHSRHEGIMVVPSGSGTRLIRVHAPYETERVEFKSAKFGDRPVAPAYTDVDSNRTFIGGGRAVTNPTLAENLNGHSWYLGGEYHYVLSEAEGLSSEFLGAKLPADPTVIVSAQDANQQLPRVNIPATQFVTGILGKPF